MVRDVSERVGDRVRTHALRFILERQQSRTNLSLDRHVYEAGERIGPALQGIRADVASVVVFADDSPLSNFGHPCRYLIYSAESGEFLREVPARFPPTLRHGRERLTPFFRPVVYQNDGISPLHPEFPWPVPFRCPFFFPEGNRYAILYAGLTQGRHLNDMEFCYRTLVNLYGFDPANVYALSYDGTLTVWDVDLGTWPGNNTAYQIQITGKGTRAAMQSALNDLKGKIVAEDLLFIHMNNHGDNFNDGNGSFLAAFVEDDPVHPDPDVQPDWTPYYASQFASDLGVLPAHRALIMMMEQCCSGGFNAPVIAASTAASKSVSAAATATVPSAGGADWDPFAYDWIAAANGAYPDGSALAYNPVTGTGAVTAQEAYNYAATEDTEDTPQYNDAPSTETLGLTEPYEFDWIWCWFIRPVLEPLYREYFLFPSVPPNPNPPDPAAYYAVLREVLPQFQQILDSAPQAQLLELRRQLVSQFTPIVKRAREAATSRSRQ